MRNLRALASATAIFLSVGSGALAQTPPRPKAAPLPPVRAAMPAAVSAPTRAGAPEALPPAAAPPQTEIAVATITLADIGFRNGIRLANLSGRRDVFVPLPQGAGLRATALTLTFDDLTAYEAKRNLEVLVNDRVVAAVPLETGGIGRDLRIPLGNAVARDGFLKLTFVYSGAASAERCVDVRYVGDSLTIRPETALAIEFDSAALTDIATIAALMPREVTVALPAELGENEIAAALTVGRALVATGRQPQFRTGPLVRAPARDSDGRRKWTHGTVLIGPPLNVTGSIVVASATAEVPVEPGELTAVHVGGLPALMIADVTSSMRAARLLSMPALSALRGLSRASVGLVTAPSLPRDRVTFDQLGLTLPTAEIFGRADLGVTVDSRVLPADTRIARLALDLMVAPDPYGEKAVITLFVNDRLLTSTLAAASGTTRIDTELPDGLIGTSLNVRAMVQRRTAGGECKFEPQGYPAQILGSSALVLASAGTARDFADLATRWSEGVDVILPSVPAHPSQALHLLTEILAPLAPDGAPITVKFAAADFKPERAFLAVSDTPPAGATPRVRFDRGRVTVNDRAGRTLLDVGGFSSGAVAQLVQANGRPGLWVKPLAEDGQLPAPASLKLDRGDVAFLDQAGLALAMSTERDTLIAVAYPDQVSWVQVAERFHSWIVGALWLFATIAFMFALQRMMRRRPHAGGE
jgi:hypothetical protein